MLIPTTRFAPSPTGALHLGHAHSALFAWHAARRAGGRFLLRIEDIDPTRCRAEFESGIHADLAWLGLAWEEPVRRQSEHLDLYARVLADLDGLGVLYPCFCTRGDIQAEIARAGGAPHGPDGPLYPGTCRSLDPVKRREHVAAGQAHALRLDVAAAVRRSGPLRWYDRGLGWQTARPESLGDVVLSRKETPGSYHLCVTVDDHEQGVTVVTRGMDLVSATHVHRVLQALLGLDVPEWHHHGLLTDSEGRRLAKRDRAETLAALREAGHSPAAVRARAGFPDSDP